MFSEQADLVLSFSAVQDIDDIAIQDAYDAAWEGVSKHGPDDKANK